MAENIQKTLNKYFIGFDTKNCFIYCKTCQIVLLKNGKRHVTEFHRIRILKEDLPNMTNFFKNNIPCIDTYNSTRKDFDCEALSYLKIFSGLKCVACLYCCVEESSIRRHVCISDKITTIRKKVQSLNYKNHTPFYSVVEQAHNEFPASSFPNVVQVVLDTIIESKLKRDLPFETNAGLLKIYSMIGWYNIDDPN